MKSSLIKVNHFIPLLTDMLPYEVPFLFSNRGIYETLKQKYDSYFIELNRDKAKGKDVEDKRVDLHNYFLKEFFSGVNVDELKNAVERISFTIPYCYEIKKNEKDFRTISLIHPLAQIKACDLYKAHEEAILFYCSRSLYSLRYPDRVTTRLTTKHASLLTKLFKEEEKANTSDMKQKVIEDHELISLSEIPTNYFVYERYGRLHDFYDSPKYIDLEKKFNNCRHFDVKRCFDSIYSHSISWATKNKTYTKINKNRLGQNNIFEDIFDNLMQFSNYKETNGIPIGSELSRIFAEIILQKIDLNIKNQLNEIKFDGNVITKGRDFEILRYIDGYYVFTNDISLSKKIQRVCEDELKEFKLFLNETKTNSVSRPFTTNISSAKQKVSQAIYLHLNSYDGNPQAVDEVYQDRVFLNSIRYNAGLNLIRNLRCITHDYEITFYEVANISLAAIKSDLLKRLAVLQELDEVEVSKRKHKIKLYIKNIIAISFYIFSSSPRSHTCSTIFKISYIILELLKAINDKAISGEIKQELYTQHLMFYESLEGSGNNDMLEFLDILLFIRQLGNNFKLDESRICNVFKIEYLNTDEPDKMKSDLSYFEMVVLMSYIQNESIYDHIKCHLIEKVEDKFSSFGLESTENFLLIFDFIKCPYFTSKEKKVMLGYAGLNDNKMNIINFIENKRWFFDWDKTEKLDLKTVLEIKETRLGY